MTRKKLDVIMVMSQMMTVREIYVRIMLAVLAISCRIILSNPAAKKLKTVMKMVTSANMMILIMLNHYDGSNIAVEIVNE